MKLVNIAAAVVLMAFALGGCQKQESATLAIEASESKPSETEHPYPYKEGDAIPAMAYIEHDEVYNPESVIPPQCYTKTNGENNPCYACHQSYSDEKDRPNIMRDGALQGDYQFSDLGTTNHWKNLFVDRTQLIADISDQDIKTWINQDNYTPFIEQMKNDTQWRGEVAEIQNLAYPDKAFDDKGLAKDGSHWVAYNYKPFPSTFWPTNGSTGDAMIRLAEPYRELDGEYSQDVYFANLALVEMALKGANVLSVDGISEVKVNQDLNGDGVLSEQVTSIQRSSHYVGDAQDVELAHMLYPQDTEFLHTVRYLGVDDQGQIFNAPRMKEVRYMKKHIFKAPQRLATAYYRESKEKHFEKMPQTRYLGDPGINNNFGWTINGYIEGADGALRPQHKQELAFCNGCHKTVGATYDQTFSFPRKVDGAQGWGYINLANMQDAPNLGEEKGEFLTYMERVGGGDEFRQNQEMLSRWFTSDGRVDQEKVQGVASLYDLIMPSQRRALDLNKAYLTIVKEQSFLFGRDATLTKATNVLEQVDDSQAPLKPEHRHQWDLRLDWQSQQTQEVTRTGGQ